MSSDEMEKEKNAALSFVSIVGFCHNRVILWRLKQWKSCVSALVFLLGLFKDFSWLLGEILDLDFM